MSWVTIWLRYGGFGAFEEDPAFCGTDRWSKEQRLRGFQAGSCEPSADAISRRLLVGDTNNAISMQGVHAYFRGGYDGGRR